MIFGTAELKWVQKGKYQPPTDWVKLWGVNVHLMASWEGRGPKVLGRSARAYKAFYNFEILEQCWLIPVSPTLEVCWKQMLRKHSRASCAAEVGVHGSRSNTKELSGKLCQWRCQAEQTCDIRFESVKGDNATGARSYQKSSFSLLPWLCWVLAPLGVSAVMLKSSRMGFRLLQNMTNLFSKHRGRS